MFFLAKDTFGHNDGNRAPAIFVDCGVFFTSGST